PTEVQSLLYFSSIYAVSSALSFTLSLHDALPIFLSFAVLFLIILPQFLGGNYSSLNSETQELFIALFHSGWFVVSLWTQTLVLRSEEHTSELQSRFDIVCRLLLEKKIYSFMSSTL